MKTILALVFLFCAALGTAGEKVNILIITGGHGFEQAPFFAMFDALPGIEYTKAPLPESADLLKPGLEKEYDAIVMYDMVPGITAEQQQAFAALLKQGIGVVSLHHNLGAHRDWPEYRKIIGGKFVFKPETIDGHVIFCIAIALGALAAVLLLERVTHREEMQDQG